MGLLRSLAMLCLLIWLSWLPDLSAQSISGSTLDRARALDSLLQDYAYKAFVRPRTGIPFEGTVPSNLTGIKIAALRLRSGSLFRRGVNKYKEFEIPDGVSETPYVERLVLVYQNLGNWSTVYYPLKDYTYLAPISGLLAYDASDLLATNLPELNITATANPISIRFQDVEAAPDGIAARCVRIDLNGTLSFSSVLADNVCKTFQQGHFAIVVKSIAPSPSPVSPGPTPSIQPPPSAVPTPREEEKNENTWIIVGSVVGGLALLGLLALLAVWGQKFQQRKKMQQMERAAEVGEALHMTPIGNTKAPAATVTRTQPVLESEYVP